MERAGLPGKQRGERPNLFNPSSVNLVKALEK